MVRESSSTLAGSLMPFSHPQIEPSRVQLPQAAKAVREHMAPRLAQSPDAISGLVGGSLRQNISSHAHGRLQRAIPYALLLGPVLK